MSTRAPVPRRVRPAQCWRPALMAHPLIAGDGLFAVVLAAWWQLRRSAHLLPHLRRGRSSFLVQPGHGFVPGIMAIITLQPLLTIYRLANNPAGGRAQRLRQLLRQRLCRAERGRPGPYGRPLGEGGAEVGPAGVGPGRSWGWGDRADPDSDELLPCPRGRLGRCGRVDGLGLRREPPTCPFPVVGPRGMGARQSRLSARRRGRRTRRTGPGTSSRRPGHQQPAVTRRGAV